MNNLYINLEILERKGFKKSKNMKVEELIQEPMDSIRTRDIIKKYFR